MNKGTNDSVYISILYGPRHAAYIIGICFIMASKFKIMESDDVHCYVILLTDK